MEEVKKEAAEKIKVAIKSELGAIVFVSKRIHEAIDKDKQNDLGPLVDTLSELHKNLNKLFNELLEK